MTGNLASGVRAMWEADATAHRLGMQLVEASPGRAVVRMEVAVEHVNGLDVCHGGVIFTLADVAMSYASNAHGHTAFATSAAIDFVNPARVGESLVATATEEILRGRAGIYDVRVLTDDDEARLVGTFRGRTLSVDRDGN